MLSHSLHTSSSSSHKDKDELGNSDYQLHVHITQLSRSEAVHVSEEEVNFGTPFGVHCR